MLLIHPPLSKPCEPPAGIARLAGSIEKPSLSVVDANLDAVLRTIHGPISDNDTWTRRAKKNLNSNLDYLRQNRKWKKDKYTKSVMDINRLLEKSLYPAGVKASLGNYQDQSLSPLRSDDLIHAAETPEKNPFYPYFGDWFVPRHDGLTGISLNFLSQAVTTFSMIGYLKKNQPGTRIILGGGLVTSWINRPGWKDPFAGLVDDMVAGPGEGFVRQILGIKESSTNERPRYDCFPVNDYLSPGLILPYSTSSGCYWQKCRFCPEKAEGNPYVSLSPDRVLDDLMSLIGTYDPSMVHILDNAISPSILKNFIKTPLNRPWYGFVRMTNHFKDPEFCLGLKRSGCVMLKIGVESGDQGVLDALSKGIDLATVSAGIKNIRDAGIGTYLYFLFGTPPEGQPEAEHTMDFVKKHHEMIDYMNLFNMPTNSPDAEKYSTDKFYEGDLSLYSSFEHPKGWDRGRVRAFLNNEFKKTPGIREIIKRTPPFFTSNHAAFFLKNKDHLQIS